MNKNEEKTIKDEITEMKNAILWISKTSAKKIHNLEKKIDKHGKQVADKMSKGMEVIESERQKRMMELKYVGVEFDPISVKIGEDAVNEALREGFEPIRDFETAKGTVMVLAKWGDKNVQTKTRTERRF